MTKCHCCENDAIYLLSNTTKNKCPHCDKTKNKIGKIKLNLCDLECSGLYWGLSKTLSKEPDNVQVIYMLEKDECRYCGKRDWPGIKFSGTMDTTVIKPKSKTKIVKTKNVVKNKTTKKNKKVHDHKPGTDDSKCDFCAKKIRYKLSNVDDICCPKCQTINYSEGEYIVNLCSTRCNKMSWIVEEYLTEPACTHTQLIYKMIGYKCTECGKKSSIKTMFEGPYIGTTYR